MRALIALNDSETKDVMTQSLGVGYPGSSPMFTDSGKACIKLALENCPDIVILDTDLQDLDGFETLIQIRKFSEVPVIILSYVKRESQLVKALELGADEFVVKPIHAIEMLARIKSLLKSRQKKESGSISFNFYWPDPAGGNQGAGVSGIATGLNVLTSPSRELALGVIGVTAGSGDSIHKNKRLKKGGYDEMQSNNPRSTIGLRKSTKARLDKSRAPGQCYDGFLCQLVEMWEKLNSNPVFYETQSKNKVHLTNT